MPQPAGQEFATPQCQMISLPNGYQTLDAGYHRVQRTPATQDTTLMKAGKTCFKCGRKDHFALQCPDRRQPSTPTQGMPPPPKCNGNSTPIQAKQDYVKRRVNQLAMKEAQNASNEWYSPHQLKLRSNHFLTSFLFCSQNVRARFILKG
jgi:hypothetical protein